MLRFWFLFLSFSLCSICSAQKFTNLHIVTSPRNHLPGFPNFHFQVNGQVYKLKAGECLETKLTADSVHVVVEDKRLAKKETDEIHVSSENSDLYIWLRVIWTGNYKNPRYGAEIVCKNWFDEIKSKCKKTITE